MADDEALARNVRYLRSQLALCENDKLVQIDYEKGKITKNLRLSRIAINGTRRVVKNNLVISRWRMPTLSIWSSIHVFHGGLVEKNPKNVFQQYKLVVFLSTMWIQESGVLMLFIRKALEVSKMSKQFYPSGLAAFCFRRRAFADLLIFCIIECFYCCTLTLVSFPRRYGRLFSIPCTSSNWQYFCQRSKIHKCLSIAWFLLSLFLKRRL